MIAPDEVVAVAGEAAAMGSLGYIKGTAHE